LFGGEKRSINFEISSSHRGPGEGQGIRWQNGNEGSDNVIGKGEEKDSFLSKEKQSLGAKTAV